MAAQANLPCVPHSANLSMVTVFTLHMLGAIQNAGPYVEFSIEPTGWTDELFAAGPEGDGRQSPHPRRPRLGRDPQQGLARKGANTRSPKKHNRDQRRTTMMESNRMLT